MMFTGKERDGESGLDYFGARYFSGAQGRFTSADSTAYSKMSNPQSWNLYAYAFNSPLKFTDPTGNEVRLANCSSEEECSRTLAAIRNAVANRYAASRVGMQKIERSGLGRLWAAITGAPQHRVTISGDPASFRSLGQNAVRLADMVTGSKVVHAAIATLAPIPGAIGGGQMQFAGGLAGTPSQGADPPFAYVKPDPWREDPDTAGIIGGKYGTIPGANPGAAMAHELLGHLWGEMFGGQRAGVFGNLRESVQAENAVRATDPTRGLKTQHHGRPVYTAQEIEKMMKRQ